MANYKVVDADVLDEGLNNIATHLREYGPNDTKNTKFEFPLGMVYQVSQVYNNGRDYGLSKGYDNGYIDGYSDGYSDGGQQGHNEGILEGKAITMDKVLGSGNRKSFESAFLSWNLEGFYLPYTIQPTSAKYMFSSTYNMNPIAIDLSNYPIDFSQCVDFTYTFNNSAIGKIGVLNTTSADSLTTLLCNAKQVVTIEELILKDDGSQSTGSNTFNACLSLTNINSVTGYFGGNISLKNSSLLSKNTVENIFAHLYNYSGTSTTRTLTLHGDVKILQSQVNDANNKGWTVTGGTVVSEEEYYA